MGPTTDSSIGANIQGPSLVRVPDWVEDPLGRYYLYFADHKGSYIRLAHADELTGPWKVHRPGSLHLAESHFLTEPPPATDEEIELVRQAYLDVLGSTELAHSLTVDATTPHIASPDVHIDHDHRRFVMYFHGLEALGSQVSRAALSDDGIHFTARSEILGLPYLRAFRHRDQVYALAMPGHFSRSADGLSGFEPGPVLFEKHMRHSALAVRGDLLHVFWSRAGDAPERILCSTVDISGDWMSWAEGPAFEVLRPELPWEGADAPIEPSVRSVAHGHVNQLRDPAIFEEGDRTYLLYAVAGESGIALAALDL